MVGKVHYQTGLAIGLATSYLLTKENGDVFLLLGSTFLGGIGALVPDIDTKDSIISKKCYRISKIFRKITEHRGITHSLFFFIFLAGGCYGLLRGLHAPIKAYVLPASFLSGILIHLLQDILTKGGAPLLYPLRKRRYSLSPFPSGSKIEEFLSVMLILGYTECLHFLLYDTFLVPCG